LAEAAAAVLAARFAGRGFLALTFAARSPPASLLRLPRVAEPFLFRFAMIARPLLESAKS
jgi:hypothetical protein